MNDSNIYEKEQKIQDKLKEELIFITQNNLKKAEEKYEEFTEQLLRNRFYKKRDQMREYAAKISKNSKKLEKETESKKIKENLKGEQDIIRASSKYLKDMIKFQFDAMFNEDLKKLQNGIDDIFNMDGINRNIKSIYNSINNNEYSVENINERYEKSVARFEEVYKQYLLKNMKYKEELEVYNKRQEQILNENIDCKKEYNDINNYLNSFKIDNKENEACNKLDDLIDSL
jgi:hypothetical protein